MEPVGSAAYKLALVAGGLCHGTFTVHPRSEWDLAAGALLIQEAGGVVTDSLGRPLHFNQRDLVRQGVVAAGPRLHPLLLEAVAVLREGSA
jgi:myo-inositol-1(or 4)-monophosphatase